MQLSWNDRYRALIAGLDILGVRQLDQSLEVQLVGGLTTVAPRARYMSLWPSMKRERAFSGLPAAA